MPVPQAAALPLHCRIGCRNHSLCYSSIILCKLFLILCSQNRRVQVLFFKTWKCDFLKNEVVIFIFCWIFKHFIYLKATMAEKKRDRESCHFGFSNGLDGPSSAFSGECVGMAVTGTWFWGATSVPSSSLLLCAVTLVPGRGVVNFIFQLTFA